MRKEDTIRIDSHILGEWVRATQLKQSWIAREVGVAEKTVNRWLSGRVKQIARYNAERLCRAIGCQLEEITARDDVDIYATREEQRQAARLLQEKDLVLLVSPSDNWELAESLIKATMQPNLPLEQLGRLYNLLSITAWRQGIYQEGREHAEKARSIGERLGNPGIVHKAICNIATIESLCGRGLDALHWYEWCLEHAEHFDTQRDHAAATSNVGSVCNELGRFKESIAAQERAIAMYSMLELDFNLAIAWMSMIAARMELGQFGLAHLALEEGEHHALLSRFERGRAQMQCYRADLVSLTGTVGDAVLEVEEGMRLLERFDVFDLHCREIVARIYRRAGRIPEAYAAIERALDVSRPLPYIHARTLQERARLALAMNDPAGEVRFREEANAIFMRIGAEPRVRMEPVVEFGEMFDARSLKPETRFT